MWVETFGWLSFKPYTAFSAASLLLGPMNDSFLFSNRKKGHLKKEYSEVVDTELQILLL